MRPSTLCGLQHRKSPGGWGQLARALNLPWPLRSIAAVARGDGGPVRLLRCHRVVESEKQEPRLSDEPGLLGDQPNVCGEARAGRKCSLRRLGWRCRERPDRKREPTGRGRPRPPPYRNGGRLRQSFAITRCCSCSTTGAAKNDCTWEQLEVRLTAGALYLRPCLRLGQAPGGILPIGAVQDSTYRKGQVCGRVIHKGCRPKPILPSFWLLHLEFRESEQRGAKFIGEVSRASELGLVLRIVATLPVRALRIGG
jgi:hypothetical protein